MKSFIIIYVIEIIIFFFVFNMVFFIVFLIEFVKNKNFKRRFFDFILNQDFKSLE